VFCGLLSCLVFVGVLFVCLVLGSVLGGGGGWWVWCLGGGGVGGVVVTYQIGLSFYFN
jgi:hypothetical protein